jgi:Family of unknown function (DUF6159)
MTATWQPPEGAGAAYDPAPRGRIRRGIWLTRKAWALMASGDGLWTLPVLAAVTLGLAAALIFAPLGVLVGEGAPTAVLVAGIVVAAFLLTTISTFFSVAFLGQVEAHIDGNQMSTTDAFEFARGRLGAIVGWSLLTTIVGLAMRALENVNGGDLLARVVGALGGLAWSLATFFVVPVLAVEDVGPVEALKRSAETMKRRFGEQVTGSLVVGGVYSLAFLVFLAVVFAGVVVTAQSVPFLGVAIVAAGVSGIVATIVVSSTISRVFSLVVYRHATGRPLPTPFTSADVAASFRQKRSLFRRG